MIDVTLLICTRNRCASLAATLASVELAVAHARDSNVEVILVDNGSIDDTPQLIRSWQATQRFPVQIVREKRPGLARARNTGLASRRGRIVAMTDDDCVLHADYFTALARAFAPVTEPTIIGGRILLGDPADLPLTVKLEDHPMIADPGSFPGGFVMGANLAFSVEVIDGIGLFDERFGAGAPFLAAEDTDFLIRATRQRIPLLYNPYMVVDHHHGRRSCKDERKLLAGYSLGDGALYAKHMARDHRIFYYIVSDIQKLTYDITSPVRTHTSVRYFYWFTLLHKARGMIFYHIHTIFKSYVHIKNAIFT